MSLNFNLSCDLLFTIELLSSHSIKSTSYKHLKASYKQNPFAIYSFPREERQTRCLTFIATGPWALIKSILPSLVHLLVSIISTYFNFLTNYKRKIANLVLTFAPFALLLQFSNFFLQCITATFPLANSFQKIGLKCHIRLKCLNKHEYTTLVSKGFLSFFKEKFRKEVIFLNPPRCSTQVSYTYDPKLQVNLNQHQLHLRCISHQSFSLTTPHLCTILGLASFIQEQFN